MATEITLQERLVSAPAVNFGNGIVAYAGFFERGNVDGFIVINTIKELEDIVGKPTEDTINDFLICYDLLQYGNNLLLKRVINEASASLARIGWDVNATGGAASDPLTDSGITTFFTDYHERISDVSASLEFWAKTPFDSNNTENPTYKVYIAKYTGTDWAADANSDNAATGQNLSLGSLGDFTDYFEVGPSENELAIIITENGTIVETHLVSVTPGAKNAQGANYFITDWMNENSNYMWGFVTSDDYGDLDDINAGGDIIELELANGSKGNTPTTADINNAYESFRDKDSIFFDYIIDGFNEDSRQFIQGIVGDRMDSVAFLSPAQSVFFTGSGKNIFPKRDASVIISSLITDVKDIITGGDEVKSRAAYYGNWKQVYNPYMDDRRWIPISASAAGVKIVVNTQLNFWDVPAGDQGGLRNTLKLAWEPTAPQRKRIYKDRINDVYTDNVLGRIINGSKTLIDKNVGVSRLNIRETFRIIENFVLENSKQFFHKFNDPATRARWVGIMEPFIRDIQTRGGIVRYKIVADESINTPLVINNYTFKAYIYLEGKRPIERIEIVVIDTPAGISFEEIQV